MNPLAIGALCISLLSFGFTMSQASAALQEAGYGHRPDTVTTCHHDGLITRCHTESKTEHDTREFMDQWAPWMHYDPTDQGVNNSPDDGLGR